MLNLKRLMIFVIISVCLLISASCAFAADSNQIRDNITVDGQNHEINMDNFNVGQIDNNLVNTRVNLGVSIQINMDNGQTNGGVPGSYDDLKEDIENLHSGDVYNFSKDYIFDGGNRIVLQDNIIAINPDNIIINGNGFAIDAGGSQNFAIFKISGNNVTISNLTFANSVPGTLWVPQFLTITATKRF